jgi:hypothetical protein
VFTLTDTGEILVYGAATEPLDGEMVSQLAAGIVCAVAVQFMAP